MGEPFTLQADIVGPYSQIVYGLAGDRVTIIADHGNMLIVEAANKNRFAIRNPKEDQAAYQLQETPVQETKAVQGKFKSMRKVAIPENKQAQLF